MFLALLFVIGPYNLSIAVLVAGLGIGLELFQMAEGRRRRTDDLSVDIMDIS